MGDELRRIAAALEEYASNSAKLLELHTQIRRESSRVAACNLRISAAQLRASGKFSQAQIEAIISGSTEPEGQSDG